MVAYGVYRVLRGPDTGVGMPDEEVTVTGHLALVDRFMVRETHFVRLRPVIGVPDGAIFRFRLTRLVKLDRKTEPHHFLAEKDPFRFGPVIFTQEFCPALQKIGCDDHICRFVFFLTHGGLCWFQDHQSAKDVGNNQQWFSRFHIFYF